MQILARIREELQQHTRRWLLIGLGVNLLVGLGLAAHILLVILPPFAEGQALSLALEAAERDAEAAERAAAATPGELEGEIEAMQAAVAQRAGAFVAAAHAAEMAQRLYAHAVETGVQILTIDDRAMDDRAMLNPDETEVYWTSPLRLEASGPMAQLLLFLARIEPAAQPGVQFRDLSITDAGGGAHRLVMDLLLHISPHADASRPLPAFPMPDAVGSADPLHSELNVELPPPIAATPAPPAPTEEAAPPQLVKPENWPKDWPWPPTSP